MLLLSAHHCLDMAFQGDLMTTGRAVLVQHCVDLAPHLQPSPDEALKQKEELFSKMKDAYFEVNHSNIMTEADVESAGKS